MTDHQSTAPDAATPPVADLTPASPHPEQDNAPLSEDELSKVTGGAISTSRSNIPRPDRP